MNKSSSKRLSINELNDDDFDDSDTNKELLNRSDSLLSNQITQVKTPESPPSNPSKSDEKNVKKEKFSLTKLYPAGKILHIVRKYSRHNFNDFNALESTTKSAAVRSKATASFCYLFKENETTKESKADQSQPVYQVIEANNENFNDILISPRMIHDHMPDNLIKCMKAVFKNFFILLLSLSILVLIKTRKTRKKSLLKYYFLIFKHLS